MTQMGLDFSGESLKEAGINQVLAHTEADTPDWTECAFSLLEAFARRVGRFSSDEFREYVAGILPEPPHVNAYGGLFSRAARAGIIKSVGYVKATRAAAHRRVVTVWQMAIV